MERLCTYQYSLISLIPGTSPRGFYRPVLTDISGLLQTLQDCGSPPLASRAPTLTRPTSLRTSDRRSLLTYLGLPLDLFGKVRVSPKMLLTLYAEMCTGCILPALSPTAAARLYQVSDLLFPLREHERDRAPAERHRVAC